MSYNVPDRRLAFDALRQHRSDRRSGLEVRHAIPVVVDDASVAADTDRASG